MPLVLGAIVLGSWAEAALLSLALVSVAGLLGFASAPGGRVRTGFAAWVRALRETGALTQEKLAEEVGSHKFTIKRWERGAAVPKQVLVRRELDRVADEVGVERWDWATPREKRE